MTETRVVHIRDNVPGAVYIGRAMPRQGFKASPLGNPFKVTRYGLSESLERYRDHLQHEIFNGNRQFIEALIACRGKPIACFCRHDGQPERPDNRCHGDLIIAWLDECSDAELRAFAGVTV